MYSGCSRSSILGGVACPGYIGVAGLVPGLEGIDGSSKEKGLVALMLGSESSFHGCCRREDRDREDLVCFDSGFEEDSRLLSLILLLDIGGGGSEFFDSSSNKDSGADEELEATLAFFGGGSSFPSSSASSFSLSVGGSPSST